MGRSFVPFGELSTFMMRAARRASPFIDGIASRDGHFKRVDRSSFTCPSADELGASAILGAVELRQARRNLSFPGERPDQIFSGGDTPIQPLPLHLELCVQVGAFPRSLAAQRKEPRLRLMQRVSGLRELPLRGVERVSPKAVQKAERVAAGHTMELSSTQGIGRLRGGPRRT
jgi:hypothetical protein